MFYEQMLSPHVKKMKISQVWDKIGRNGFQKWNLR